MAGANVSLRPVGPGDKDRLLEWRNTPDVSAFMYTDHKISQPEHDAWFARIESDPRRVFWIIEMDGGPVGLANLYDIDRKQRRCAWAYYLGDPATRGKGIGAMVEFLVIERVFGKEGLSKLWCEVLGTNERVVRLHQRFGFKQEALLRQHVFKGEEPQDVVGLGLLKADWEDVRPQIVQTLGKAGFEVGGGG